jgi:uncharacterized delta-60 repeat protein
MWRGVIAAAASAALTIPAGATAAPGDPDPSFGNGGVVVVPVFAPCTGPCIPEFAGAYAQAVAIQPDGKVLVAGRVGGTRLGERGPSGAVVRLGAAGLLDPSFGHDGILEESSVSVSDVYAMPDGRFLAFGDGYLQNSQFNFPRSVGIARYSDVGLADESFGPEGVRWLGGTENAYDATVAGDGRLLLLQEAQRRLEVRRFLPSGEPDGSFGVGGTALLPFTLAYSGGERAISAGADGSVVVAYLELSRSSTQPERNRELLLARVTADGRLDRSFGHAGVEATGIALAEGGHPYAVAISPGGRIVVVVGRQGRLDTAEFSSAGTKIRLFGRDGVASFGSGEGATSARPRRPRLYRALGVSPVAIAFDRAGSAIATGEWDGNAFLARYTTKGRDCSLGTVGLAAAPQVNEPTDIAVQPDGRILMVGSRRDRRLSFVAARFMGGGVSHTCPGEGVPIRAARRRAQPVERLGAVSVHAPASPSARSALTISFAPNRHLPRGGYYYAVAVLGESSEPSCALSSDMHKTAYGFPRPKHRVFLTLYPAPSPAGRWCEQGFYQGAVYAVPHRLKCTKDYPCYRAKAAQCSYEEAERSPCIFGIVLEPVYAYPGGLPQPIDSSTKIVGRFKLRFAAGG